MGSAAFFILMKSMALTAGKGGDGQAENKPERKEGRANLTQKIAPAVGIVPYL